MQLLLPKNAIIVSIFCMISLSVNAQSDFFKPVSRFRSADVKEKNINKYVLYDIRETALNTYLSQAPLEFYNQGITLPLEVPLPNGTTEIFKMTESPVLSPEIAAQHPEIKTYTGNGTQNPNYMMRVTITPDGFNAIILGMDDGDVGYFEKAVENNSGNTYRTYFARDAVRPKNADGTSIKMRCGTKDAGVDTYKISPTNKSRFRSTIGANLRSYRLAVAADQNFTTNKGGGNVTTAYNALVGYVNRAIAVYRVELSVTFVLVSGTNVVYTTANPGRYTNNDQIKNLDENTTNLDSVIGAANYDIGHLFGYVGGSGGGVGITPSVCRTSKGGGVSGVGNGSFAAVFDDQLISHEMGHQFDMSHSYNSVIPVCTTRAAGTSVEPGAGTTMMSYGYTCSDATGNDDYEAPYQPLLNFHTVNYEQAVVYFTTGAGTCNSSTVTGNTLPVITFTTGATTIPKSTPFSLTGTATGTGLTYSWEGTNVGTVTPTSATLADPSQPPFFRTYAPSTGPTRIYPRLAAILNGTNAAIGDKLPSVGIVTTHRLTVRDNVTGVTNQDVTITVDGNSGPFLETTNLSGAYDRGTTQNITWSVANTTAAPVSCPSVDILLSRDGGQTFPFTIATAVPNNGTYAMTVPAQPTTQGRIMVKASNNIFFDISNNNFTINAATPVELTDFNARLENKNNARLNWATASEKNNAGFDIEMSKSSLADFKNIGFVIGHGNAATANTYGFIQNNLSGGIYYFRLKQSDRDGSFTYSPIKSVEVVNDNFEVTAYPNPVKDKLILGVNGDAHQRLNVQVVNQIGQVIFSRTGETFKEVYEINTAQLSAGLYFITVENGNAVNRLKFVKD